MTLLFTGAVTSSPLRKRGPPNNELCHSPDLSIQSRDSSYVCYSVNPLTGSPCSCRRSPRLLTNGYYLLTEDSYSWDNEGNVSLTPSKINVSYKENLYRIFRRRRRVRKSLTSVFSGFSKSCQSWLDGKQKMLYKPLAESSWLEYNPSELDTSCNFSYDHSVSISSIEKLAHKSMPAAEFCTEACFSEEQLNQSLGGLLDVPPSSVFLSSSCSPSTSQPLYSKNFNAFFIIFIICLFMAVCSSYRGLLVGLAGALIAFTFIVMCLPLARAFPTSKWRKARTEDITSRNE